MYSIIYCYAVHNAVHRGGGEIGEKGGEKAEIHKPVSNGGRAQDEWLNEYEFEDDFDFVWNQSGCR